MLADSNPDMSTGDGISSYCEYVVGVDILHFAAVALFWLVIKRMTMPPQPDLAAAAVAPAS